MIREWYENLKKNWKKRREEYVKWAMKNQKENIDYKIEFKEIGFCYALTLWLLFVVVLLNTILLFYHREVVTFVKLWLGLK